MKNIHKISIFLFVIVLTVTYMNIESQGAKKQKLPDNSECLMCHDDPDITMEKNGREISLTVKEFTLPRSVHRYLKCTDCHIGFSADDLPHKEVITPVLCSGCHKDVAKQHEFHPQMSKEKNKSSDDKNCKNCHGYHDVMSPKNPKAKTSFANSAEFCGKCHNKELEQHLVSEHAVMISKNNPNAPTCIYCHSNPITSGYSLDGVTLKLNQEKLCITCHLKTPHNKFSKSLIDYEKSVHGQALISGNAEAATCIDCHGVHNLKKSSDSTSTVNHFNVPKVCGRCHVTIYNEYSLSVHGISLAKGNNDAPSCTFCHGEHAIQSPLKVDNQIITENKMNLDKLESTQMLSCVKCHTNKKMMDKYKLLTISEAHNWLPNLAAHWATVRCVDCHSSYDPPNLSHNLLKRRNVVRKCEKCHSKNSILMTKLYKHEKEKSREKLGFINGTLLSDAYVVGTTRNVYLDSISYTIFGITLLGIMIHGFLRWYFRKSIKKPMDSFTDTEKTFDDEDRGGQA